MKPSLTRRFVAVLLALAFAATLAIKPTDAEAAKRGHRKSATYSSPAGSAETTRERDRRLTRECRGRPNAGACLGFGQ